MFLVKLGQYFALSRNHKEVVEMVQFLRMRAAFLQPLLLLLLPIVLKKKDIATNIYIYRDQIQYDHHGIENSNVLWMPQGKFFSVVCGCPQGSKKLSFFCLLRRKILFHGFSDFFHGFSELFRRLVKCSSQILWHTLITNFLQYLNSQIFSL